MAEPGGTTGALGGYAFGDPGLLRLALTHRSSGSPHNERLEFLGDAVLGLVIGELLYRRFPELDEGALSRLRARLVSGEYLAGVAQALHLPDRVRLGPGERKSGGARRKTILAGTLEAVIGAVYLDGGLAAVAALTDRWFSPLLETALPGQDFKTSLQELTQARYKALPSYRLLAESGPGHAKRFRVEVRVNEVSLAQGEGGTKKQAAQRAARRALEILQGDSAETVC